MCVQRINAALAGKNTKLALAAIFLTKPPRFTSVPCIATTKVRPHGPRAAVLTPNFCPFCGEKYK